MVGVGMICITNNCSLFYPDCASIMESLSHMLWTGKLPFVSRFLTMSRAGAVGINHLTLILAASLRMLNSSSCFSGLSVSDSLFMI